MNKTKKVKVVMVDTDDSSPVNIPFLCKGDKFHIHEAGGEFRRLLAENYKAQHLYIVSDDNIIEGDYYLTYNQFEGYIIEKCKHFGDFDSEAKKIVATTDESLFYTKHGILKHTVRDTDVLPQIPKSFIEKYCKQGGIDDVEIEYEAKCKEVSSLCTADSFNSGCGSCNKILKTTPNNEIIITSSKRSWNRDEVEELMWKAFHKGRTTKDDYRNWIKENL